MISLDFLRSFWNFIIPARLQWVENSEGTVGTQFALQPGANSMRQEELQRLDHELHQAAVPKNVLQSLQSALSDIECGISRNCGNKWVNYALDDNCSVKSTWALLSVWVGGLGVSCNPIFWSKKNAKNWLTWILKNHQWKYQKKKETRWQTDRQTDDKTNCENFEVVSVENGMIWWILNSK